MPQDAESDVQTLTQAIHIHWRDKPDAKVLQYVNQFRERKRIGTKITARVEGNHGTYTVTIEATTAEAAEHNIKAACSCYIGKGGYCHHCRALASTFLLAPDTFTEIKPKERAQVQELPDVAAYLESVTLETLFVQLKEQGVTQKGFAEAIGMNSRHLSAVKSSELRNHFFNELGATKLACLWVLDFVKRKQQKSD